MATSKTEDVFKLVKSLSKAEKRAFRAYAQRIQDEGSLLYVRLFDLMDRQKELDEGAIKKQIKDLDGSRYANLKRHLYQQILISLRLLYKERRPNIKIREYIDFAYVLYGRGLYIQALKVLEKAKKMAKKHHTDFSLLTIVEIEKMIHSRHITRASSQPIDDLMGEASQVSRTIVGRIDLSNLRLKLHKFYVEQGHVKNEEELSKIQNYFKQNLPKKLTEAELGMMELVYLYQSYVWYYYILNDFKNCKLYAAKWVDNFKSSEELRSRDVDLFMRGYHYLLTSLYNLKEVDEFKKHLGELEMFRKSQYSKFNANSKIISFLYVHSARLNLHFLQRTYQEGCAQIYRTLRRIKRYENELDEHKVMVLYFKIAWMYLGNQEAANSLKYLKKIIEMTPVALRDDIQAYTRLMYLMAYYDLEHFNDLPKLVKTYTRFFAKKKEKNKLQSCVLNLFQELADAPILDRKAILKKHLAELKVLQSSQFEKRAFLYLEIIPWIEGKLGLGWNR